MGAFPCLEGTGCEFCSTWSSSKGLVDRGGVIGAALELHHTRVWVVAGTDESPSDNQTVHRRSVQGFCEGPLGYAVEEEEPVSGDFFTGVLWWKTFIPGTRRLWTSLLKSHSGESVGPVDGVLGRGKSSCRP